MLRGDDTRGGLRHEESADPTRRLAWLRVLLRGINPDGEGVLDGTWKVSLARLSRYLMPAERRRAGEPRSGANLKRSRHLHGTDALTARAPGYTGAQRFAASPHVGGFRCRSGSASRLPPSPRLVVRRAPCSALPVPAGAVSLMFGCLLALLTLTGCTPATAPRVNDPAISEAPALRLDVASSATVCGRYGLHRRDSEGWPSDPVALLPIVVEADCATAPELIAIRPARVEQAAGRWTTVVLEGRNLDPRDQVMLVNRDDRRIEAAPIRLRFVDPERLELDLPADLRCGHWLVALDRPGLVAPRAQAALHWCPENVLSVLSYNVAMVPAVGLPWLRHWLPFRTAVCEPLCWTKARRASSLARHPDLLGYDVVVLQELFSRPYRRAIVDGLRRSPNGYAEASRMVPGAWPIAGGGVVILSRWPIRAGSVRPFADCAGGIRDAAGATRNDCLANKGVVHVAIDKHGRTFHVFGTHMDAGRGAADRAARERQLHELADFVRAQGIPADEAVIIAGDMNIDRFDPERERLLGEVLGAAYGPFSGCSPAPLFPTTPAGGGLDYVFYSTLHRLPLETRRQGPARSVRAATSRVVCPRSGGEDLSDHFAVVGSFVFPVEASQPPASLVAADQR